jgi:hypothetical protein
MSDNLTVQCVSSKKTSSGAVGAAKDAVIVGIVLINGGAACSCKITDGSSSSGNDLMIIRDTGTTAGTMTTLLPAFQISIPGGIYATLAGASAYAYIFYRQVRA